MRIQSRDGSSHNLSTKEREYLSSLVDQELFTLSGFVRVAKKNPALGKKFQIAQSLKRKLESGAISLS